MKTKLAVVLVSFATSAIVNAIPLPQPNYDPTLQIPQSVFDFQTPNILTRSEGLWGDGTEFLLADSEPNPAAPTPDQKQSGEPEPFRTPGGEDNQQQVVPQKDSGINVPILSKPEAHDITHSQPPDVNPTNGDFGGLIDSLRSLGW